MALDPSLRTPLMAITHDLPGLPHLEQVRRLLLAGVSWIQLRMKSGTDDEKLAIASAAAAMCRSANAILIVNDSVDIALRAGASGVHLGKDDEAWAPARSRLGRTLILGGTVNNPEDAARAVAAASLDYVGVGPWRATATKQKLAPVLGPQAVASLVARVSPLPAWVIGGVLPGDMAAIRAADAAGAAVSGGLIQEDVRGAVQDYLNAWGNF